MCRLLLIPGFLFVATLIQAAEVIPAGVVPPYSLVRVNLEAGERAWIISEKFTAVDVEQCGSRLVWTGPPGRYAILSWTESQQTQQIVTIGGTGPNPPDPPNPPPPNPDPPNPPDPPTPPPIAILNDYGIGGIAYQEALKVNVPAEARVLGDAARLALNALIEGRVTPAGAEAVLKSKRELLKGNWQGWEAKVEQAMAAAIAKYGGGALRYRDYFLELAVALETAGAQMKR